MTYRIVAVAIVATMCVSCASQRTLRPSAAPVASSNIPTTSPGVRRLSDDRRNVLVAQQTYLQNEGISHRGICFQKLVNAIERAKLKEPPVTELELLELLGPPDYDSSDEDGPGYIYLVDVNAKKDGFFIFDIDQTGCLRQVGFNMASTLDRQKCKPYTQAPEIR